MLTWMLTFLLIGFSSYFVLIFLSRFVFIPHGERIAHGYSAFSNCFVLCLPCLYVIPRACGFSFEEVHLLNCFLSIALHCFCIATITLLLQKQDILITAAISNGILVLTQLSFDIRLNIAILAQSLVLMYTIFRKRKG